MAPNVPRWLALLAGTLLAGGALPAQENGVLGRIGALEIKVDDVRRSLHGLGEIQESAVARDPALLSQVVRSLLVQRAVLKEAAEKKWDQRSEVVAQLAQARDTALAESYLQSVSTPPEGFPDDAELKAAYEANREALRVPRSYRVAQIFVSSPKGADKATADKAQAKLEQIKKLLKQKDADFAAIAKEHSEEVASAARGGEVGWLAEDNIQPDIRAVAAKLDLNAVSEPLRLEDGWHVLKVLDAREPHTPTLEQVRPQLTQQLRAERTKAGLQAYLAKLLKDNPLAINELALSEVLEDKAK